MFLLLFCSFYLDFPQWIGSLGFQSITELVWELFSSSKVSSVGLWVHINSSLVCAPSLFSMARNNTILIISLKMQSLAQKSLKIHVLVPLAQLTLPGGRQLSQYLTRQQPGTPSTRLENGIGRHCWWCLGRSADPFRKKRFSLPPRSLEILHTTTTTYGPWRGLVLYPAQLSSCHFGPVPLCSL